MHLDRGRGEPRGRRSRTSPSSAAPVLQVLVLAAFVLGAGISRGLCADAAGGEHGESGETSGETKPALVPPEACQPCHPQHYEEWRGSMHAYAIEDPVFHAMNQFGQRDTKGELGDFCVRCHAPLATLTGESRGDLSGADALSPIARSGISCEVCHRDVRLREGHPANASLELTPGGPMVGGIEDPAPNGFHASRGSALLRTPEFCGACHNVVNPRGVAVEKPHVEYVASEYPDRYVRCIDCHMQVYSGRAATDGPIRAHLHRHDFVGVDTALTPFPRREFQRREVEDFLRTAAVLSVRMPNRLRSGEEARLEIDVKNAGAGHNLPTGPSTEREMWLEVTVETDDGETLLRSGHLGPDGELALGHGVLPASADPQLVVFTDRFLDAVGREVPFLWQAHRLEERTIPPLATRTSRYSFIVPAATQAQRVAVRVRLLFRAFPPHQLERLELSHLRDRFPVFVLQEFVAPEIELVEASPAGLIRVPDDVADLASAIRDARPGDEIRVGPGRYELGAPLDFAGRDLTLRSREGAARTVLVPAPALEDRPLVHFRGGETRAAALEGFTFDGSSRTSGRAIECTSADPRIEQNIFRGHSSLEDGGAALFESSFAHLIANRFEANRSSARGGALRIAGSGSVLIEDSFFSRNEALAGGAISSDAGVILLASRFTANIALRGGALQIFPRPFEEGELGAILVRGCFITGNSAERGGGLQIDGDGVVEMERTVIAGNLGGGLDAAGGALVLAPHTTLVDQRGGPASSTDASSRIVFTSSILIGNRPQSIAGEVHYSLVDDASHIGETNIAGFSSFAGIAALWERCSEAGEEGCLPFIRGGDLHPSSSTFWRRYKPGSYCPLPTSMVVDAGDPRGPPDPDGTRPDLGALYAPQPAHFFRRGDLDGDADATSADLRALGSALADPFALPCREAADVDGDGRIAPSDFSFLAGLIFARHAALPPPPFFDCGPQPSWLGPGSGCFEDICSAR